ncbi:IS66 family insertion sequence element accessory protein TnpB [Pseudomonas aeruginosa]|uniref:IS66 family insertion sequence element accessory protein TnpB n=4 Tax=Pseudomonas aeruginosa TaxID=287 RepID=UPI001375E0FD|nr:IS66 family insertion sequence element accessory protein TnpB [Pseudomonas aeruginosa]
MPGQRRSYPKSFKAQIVEECTQPGASVAGVALSHGLNANLVHKWIRRQQAQLPAVPSSFIPIPLVWLATEPLDMRAGTETALARVVQVFGAAQPHCAYLFTNKRANRMKVLVHDGFGIWLAARRLNRGRFVWSGNWQGQQLELSSEQLQALVIGLPWQRLGPNAEIRLL